MTCECCQAELVVGDWPFCPHGRGHNNVIGDEIDHVQVNGCKSPIHFRSREERKKYLKAHGWREKDSHKPPEGTDKSPFTSRHDAVSQHTLDNAKALLERVANDKKQSWRNPEDAPIGITSDEGLIRYMRDQRAADHNQFGFSGR